MDRGEYRRKYGKRITQDEANVILAEGTGIVSAGGYILYSDSGGYHYYHAFGTFPGCVRGCAKADVNDQITEWYSITPIDLICLTGYKPTEHRSILSHFSSLPECPDWDELDRTFVEANLSLDTQTDPELNAEFWRRHFSRNRQYNHL
jgi:hypothetical protein